MVDVAASPTQQTAPLTPAAASPQASATADGGTVGGQTTAPQPSPYPDVDTVMKVLPKTSRRNVERNLPLILKAMVEFDMLSKNQLIGVIATIGTETAGFASIKEMNPGLSNISGGAQYYGRGFVQLTHRGNYEAAKKKFGLDLVGNPDLALEPELAARIMMWFWRGGTGGPDIKPYAESGDFDNVRSCVNAGRPGRISRCWGVPHFREYVANGQKYFTQGIDPNAVSSASPGNYGLGCVDTGSGSSRTLSGMQGVTTQGDALAYALGLHFLDRQKSHQFRAVMVAAQHTDILQLDAQKTFTASSFGANLDGDYTVEEVLIWPLAPGIEVEVHGYKPDPNAPNPQVFLHNTASGIGPEVPRTPAGTPGGASNVPVSEINQRIYESAKAYIGTDTSAGPEGGNKACAWSVNNILDRAIGRSIPNNSGRVACIAMRDALRSEGAQEFQDAGQATNGDLAFFNSWGHVGIVLDGKIYSNSSSRARWSWGADMTFGGHDPVHFFRIQK